MTIRVGINGFGRIGRNFWRAANAAGGDGGQAGDIEIAAANDLGDVATMAHLLKYDSVLGTLPMAVSADGDTITAGGRERIGRDLVAGVFGLFKPSQAPALARQTCHQGQGFGSADRAWIHRVRKAGPAKSRPLASILSARQPPFIRHASSLIEIGASARSREQPALTRSGWPCRPISAPPRRSSRRDRPVVRDGTRRARRGWGSKVRTESSR